VSADTSTVNISVVDTPVVDTPVVDIPVADASVVDTSARSLSSTVVVDGFDVDHSTASVLVAVVDRTVVVPPSSSALSSR